MPLATTAELLAEAEASGRGLAAFNVITLEHAEAIAAGAEEAGLSAVLGISENAIAFHHGLAEPIVSAAAAVARAARVPLSVHLDHIEDEALLRQAGEHGSSSVMYDASRQSYDANVASTRAAARWAHERGLLIEAELGEVGGKGRPHDPGTRTDPQQARDFVERTGVDALAVAVGSSHAMVDRSARLDHDLIARLREAVPVPLVLHGSSGVPDDELARALRHGMVKVNIGTALNVALTRAVREHLDADPDVVDPRRYLGDGRAAMAGEVARLLRVLASAPAA